MTDPTTQMPAPPAEGRDATRLSFKEMLARFDVTPRTLRYYEYIELLTPERDGRARWYGPREVARMTLILRGRRWGFPLEEIRQWLEMYERQGTESQMRAMVDLAGRQLEELEGKRRELDAVIAELNDLRADLTGQLDAGPARKSGTGG
ncbi:MAG: MerR family transcriptional regulator [Shimia sp.]